MTFYEFLSDRLGKIVLQGIIMAAASVFLLATGTQPGVVLLLLIILFLVFAAASAVSFIRCRARLKELEAILGGLNQKYLFAECVPAQGSVYERRLFQFLRRSGKSMISAVSDAQASQQEYQEYIERWVHEIKAPITAARLISHSVDGEIRRKLEKELAAIEAHVERALFYARAGSPEKDLIVRQAKLSAIVSQAILNHRALLIQSGVRVETEDLGQTVYTDEKWAVFLLGQLLQNAARYQGENPVITLSARWLGRQVQLTVQDNGIGIPAHEISRVFDRGFTGSNGRIYGGSTGMGLYLCRKLAECLEMEIQIASKEGEGTKVTLTFPAKNLDN